MTARSLGSTADRRVWRILSPRWVHDPLSGAGAAQHGGRWNRPGQAALYLSEQIETAFAEYQQEYGVRPGFFIAYRLAAKSLIDLTDERVLKAIGVTRNDLTAPWKDIAWADNGSPPSWALSEQLIEQFSGMRVPSVRYAGGTNVVLWRWNSPRAPHLEVLDPRHELPPA